MSQVNTQQMGRMVAAGNKADLGQAVDILAHLGALHIIDYDGSEDGFTLGSPEEGSEGVGRELVKARAAASVVEATGPTRPVPAGPVRDSLEDDLPSKIDQVLSDSSRIDDLENEISSLAEEEDALSRVSPLGVDLDLLGGYKSITSFVGTVENLAEAREAVGSGLFIEGKNGKSGLIAAFVRNEESG